MFKRAALSLLLFTAFVFAVQERELRRLAPRLRDPVHEDTNAKRFARGLPPLPPRRNIEASRTDAARRSLPSDTQIWSGKIKVSSVKDTIGPENKALGYLALNANQTYYVVVSDLNNASTFTATLRQYGITTNVSFKDKVRYLSSFVYH
ncbi:uncharacterized protein EI90DRAFT_1141781 [Cantharellus anzutake]|uniref:uncharacterized protein n=1 Tax=Cantharellus anzutake TaxID=1750568 RepID=UPI001904FBE6|nr:uncharacterized protein EI90DRAFT_1141781 [Cantharellus anzutake]KAF8330597.1 hypothetical protein EI90DRAFT_1141781 [Cantharellus anzutake]